LLSDTFALVATSSRVPPTAIGMPLLAVTAPPSAEARTHSNRGPPAVLLADRNGSMAAAKLIIENCGTRKKAIRTGWPMSLYSTKRHNVAVQHCQVGFAHALGWGSTDDPCMQKLAVLALIVGVVAGSIVEARSARPLAVSELLAGNAGNAPVANSALYPGKDALPAPPFTGVLHIQQTALQTNPVLTKPLQDGRDARLFPGVSLEFFTVDGHLIPVQMGEMVAESAPGRVRSYWRVIAQAGRVWHEASDGAWSRASFPVMLVSDMENQSHQGLATFVYREGQVSGLHLQFVQQSAPWLLQHFVAWGRAPVKMSAVDPAGLPARMDAARAELAGRLPAKPWNDLMQTATPGALDGFGGPLYPKWRVGAALVRQGILYYQESVTPYGPYPYPYYPYYGPSVGFSFGFGGHRGGFRHWHH